jgi:hypothetical protein
MVVKIHIVVFLVMIQYSVRWVLDYMVSQPGRPQYEKRENGKAIPVTDRRGSHIF